MTVCVLQAKRTLKAHKLQDELASGKLDQSVSIQSCQHLLNIVMKGHMQYCLRSSAKITMATRFNAWNCFFFLQEREHGSEDEDEDKYADDIDMPGQNFDSKRRITVRNLRIREDTAKVRGTHSLTLFG